VGAPPPDTLLLIRDVQLSDRALVPIEQFGLGGLESVRGYQVSIQIMLLLLRRLPVLRIPVSGVLQLAPLLMSAPPGTAPVESRP